MPIRLGVSCFVITGMLAMSLLTVACSVFGIRSTEEPAYEVKLEVGNKEIRSYEGFIVAKTVVEGEYDDSGGIAFRRLFDYISGSNTKQESISMTAPVIQEAQGTKIEMTAPVIQGQSERGWEMSFVMPARYTMETIPAPVDPNVKLERIPGKTVAVWSYTGLTSAKAINELGAQLQQWSEDNGFRAVSNPRLARYDPPWTIPFLRRNEIHLDVRQREGGPSNTEG